MVSLRPITSKVIDKGVKMPFLKSVDINFEFNKEKSMESDGNNLFMRVFNQKHHFWQKTSIYIKI